MPQVLFSVTTDYMHATAEGCVRVVAVLHNSNMMVKRYHQQNQILPKGGVLFTGSSLMEMFSD